MQLEVLPLGIAAGLSRDAPELCELFEISQLLAEHPEARITETRWREVLGYPDGVNTVEVASSAEEETLMAVESTAQEDDRMAVVSTAEELSRTALSTLPPNTNSPAPPPSPPSLTEPSPTARMSSPVDDMDPEVVPSGPTPSAAHASGAAPEATQMSNVAPTAQTSVPGLDLDSEVVVMSGPTPSAALNLMLHQDRPSLANPWSYWV